MLDMVKNNTLDVFVCCTDLSLKKVKTKKEKKTEFEY
jgi:hypothetical protein